MMPEEMTFKTIFDINYNLEKDVNLSDLSDLNSRLQNGLCKTKLDLHYSEEMEEVGQTTPSSGNNRKRRPLIIFVHGGGWRRGHPQNWRHFLSRFDTNLLMAAISQRNNFYGNVAKGFVKIGYPCAIISYPLERPPLSILLLETVTSFVMSAFFCAIPSAIFYLVVKVVSYALSMYGTSYKPFDVLYKGIELLAKLISGRKLPSLLNISQSATMFILLMNLTNYLNVSIFSGNFVNITFASSLTGLVVGTLFKVAGNFFTNIEQKLDFVSLSLVLLVQGSILAIQLCNWSRESPDFAATVDDQVRYITKAIKWFSCQGDQDIYDPQSIVLCGHSAGGHLSTLLTLDQAYLGEKHLKVTIVKGVISISGVYNPEKFGESQIASFLYFNPAFGKVKSQWKHFSPLKRAASSKPSDKSPKYLLMVAEYDYYQIKEDAKKFKSALNGVGYDCTLIEIPKVNHFNSFCNIGRQGLVRDTISAFLARIQESN